MNGTVESRDTQAGTPAVQSATDTVVFWDDEGMEIVAITSRDIDSDVLCDIFDTPSTRAAIEEASGRMVDNTSEESFEDGFAGWARI